MPMRWWKVWESGTVWRPFVCLRTLTITRPFAFVINVRTNFHFQDGIVMRRGGEERGEYYRERFEAVFRW